MSTLVLITGTIHRGPDVRTSKNGSAYLTLTVRVPTHSAVEFWSCVVFSSDAKRELEDLGPGDGVSLVGTPKAEIYMKNGQTRVSLSLTTDRALALKKRPRERDGHERQLANPDPKELS